MAVSRATASTLRSALTKSLTTLPAKQQQTRSLRITAHVEASPFLTTQKPSFTKIQAAISDAAAAAAPQETPPSTRQFNTSRSLKAVNDSSTIDFAFLPDFDPDAGAPVVALRVPLLPEGIYPGSSTVAYSKEDELLSEPPTMRPEISTTAHPSTHVVPPTAFASEVDGHDVSFEGVAGAIKDKAVEIAEDKGSVLGTVVGDMLTDIFGPPAKKA